MLVGIAIAALTSACASTGAVPRVFPSPRAEAIEPEPPAAANTPASLGAEGGIDALLKTALGLRGTPYQPGGTTQRGFDCSGFTQYVFGQHGIALPRDTRDQFRAGATVARAALVAGDLLFFTTTARGPSHVGLALDGESFIHAPSTEGVVRVERLSAPYWTKRFIGAKRIVTGSAAPD